MNAWVQGPYNATVRLMLEALERNLLPDFVIRRLTRLLLAGRLRCGYKPSSEQQLSHLIEFVNFVQRIDLATQLLGKISERIDTPSAKVRAWESILDPCSRVPTTESEDIIECSSLRRVHQATLDTTARVDSLEEMPIAIETDKPKSQHYELPASFFKIVLGKNLKYSCCYFQDKSNTLEDAEKAMLELYCERAQIRDGQTILDVGCGWGSFSLYIAEKFAGCHVTGICNSATQKDYIEEQCRKRELSNVEIVAADISKFDMESTFDRILSIEMFEHMKNYRELLRKIWKWMKPDSLLFIHHFCHKVFPYHFEEISQDDWITKYFFTGGTMPSTNLLLYFQDDVTVVNHWLVNGTHYQQTSEEWLKRMDDNSATIQPIIESTYGKDSAVKWTAYWRTFFITVAELFGCENGEEWMVAHFLFKKK